ncbi:MAG: hypothetical protein GX358_04965 [candidate division WS1 bacterium]|nr:hypothetical protein [candidate division WS1 bacterium]
MKTKAFVFVLLLAIFVPIHVAAQEVSMAKADFEPLIGGCGGVYFMAEPGELIVEVVKRDRNRSAATTEMRALLVGPDRQVLQEVFIPDDGEPVGEVLGPPLTARLTTMVEYPGIYALNITVSNDRYGTNMRWGFRTNCPRYIIETARGHRDERHQEPIVLESPDTPATVAFQPRTGAFSIEVAELPTDATAPVLYAADGQQVGVLERDEEGIYVLEIPADVHRSSVPWQLHLSAAQATISADGLTRWDSGDPIRESCLWSPDAGSWFPLIDNRWLLTPYRRVVYDEPGQAGELTLQAHNNATHERRLDFTVEADGDRCPIELTAAAHEVTLDGGQAIPIAVRYIMPQGEGPHIARVRVTAADAPDITTYSTIILQPGQAPASRPLDMPIELKPYAHENEQFGYLPDYPIEHQPYFDAQNRPYMRAGAGIATWRDGQWAETRVNDAIVDRPEVFEDGAFSLSTTKIAFDADGGIYLPATCNDRNAMLYSPDGGLSFVPFEVPGQRGSIDIEQFSGHNMPEGPPPFVRFRRTEKDPNLKWRSVNDLELFVPQMVDNKLVIGEPVSLTRDCIGFSGHSGMPSAIVSRGDLIHVTWGEATDPAADVPGVPTYVATYDRATATLGSPALIGYGPPANDGHNTPSITMDSAGRPHVLIGTHGRPFGYSQPLEDGTGWTEPVLAGENLSQTYIGFVCGPDDTLHAVFRLWWRSAEPFPNAHHGTLAYMRKLPGQPWEEPRVLIRSPFSEYSVFYHRLTIDQLGRLFISYDAWSTHWFYRNDIIGETLARQGTRRALIMSPDGGQTWKMAETEDLVGAM